MRRPSRGWKDCWRACQPDRETLAAHPWLQPMADRLLHPQLWRFNHEAVARGAAVGLFWAFMIPLAQVVVAVASCLWWRANIPVAVAMTMVTNPLTIGFWLWLAYQSGALVLGVPPVPTGQDAGGVLGWLAAFGWPAVLGMGMFGVAGAILGYFSIKLLWQLRLASRRVGRQRAR